MESHKELEVWKRLIELVDEIYIITRLLLKSEVYGLVSQMQRSSVSIPSNIAEGYNRNHRPEYIQFLRIANASAAELDTQIIICHRQYSELNYKKVESLLIEVQKMLYVIIKKLR